MKVQEESSRKPKVTTIIVNGRPREVEGKAVSFEQVVQLAFDPVPEGENIVIAVTYAGAKGPKREGILNPGESIEIRNHTSFDVKVNNKS